MTCLEALADYRTKLLSETVSDRYAALSFALQLPGICGRLEFPPTKKVNGETEAVEYPVEIYKKDKGSESGYSPRDKDMFVYWFRMHRSQFAPLFYTQDLSVDQLAADLYELRNSLTHEGVVKGFCEHVVLVDGAGACFEDTGRFSFVPVKDFCTLVFDVAERVFKNYEQQNRCPLQFCSYSGCGVDVNVYKRVSCFIEQQFCAFWEKYGREAHVLNMVYETVFLSAPNRIQDATAHFAKNLDEPYVLDKCPSVTFPDDIVCFSKKYPRLYRRGELYDGIVLRMTKSQFDYMQEIHERLLDYAKFVNDQVAEMLQNGDALE